MPSPASVPLSGIPDAGELADRVGRVLAEAPIATPPTDGHLAAVLILLYQRDGEPHFVLTKRTDTLEHHPGQVSLPGGRWDPEDADLRFTALRETHEELGVDPASVTVVGRLADVETMVSGFVVAPFVGFTAAPLVAVPNEWEIARVLEISVRSLLDADRRLPTAPDVLSLRYPLLGEDVWGATARILRAFSAVVRDTLSGSAR